MMEFHEAANEFPLMDHARLEALTADIQARGQQVPIQLFAGKILDGRNRFLACIAADVQPIFEELRADLDPFAHVWSLKRRRCERSRTGSGARRRRGSRLQAQTAKRITLMRLKYNDAVIPCLVMDARESQLSNTTMPPSISCAWTPQIVEAVTKDD